MTDGRFTRGPWTVRYGSFAGKSWIEKIVGPDGETIRTIGIALSHSSDGVPEANAHLIAASPALFEALGDLLAAFDITADNFEEVEFRGEMIAPIDIADHIRAVLALAKGETK